MEYQILRLKDVIAMTGLSRSTIYLRMEQDKFPQQINLGSRAVGWISSEIKEWIEERIKESRLRKTLNWNIVHRLSVLRILSENWGPLLLGKVFFFLGKNIEFLEKSWKDFQRNSLVIPATYPWFWKILKNWAAPPPQTIKKSYISLWGKRPLKKSRKRIYIYNNNNNNNNI